MKNHSKALGLMALLLAAALLLCACGSSSSGKYTFSQFDERTSEGSITNTYTGFDGYKTYTVNLKKDAVLKVDVTTQAGNIEVAVKNPDGAVQNIKSATAGELTVPVDKEGAWSVTFTAEKHDGSYTITW